MQTRSCHERRANTRYAGEEWAEDVDVIDADVHRMEDDRWVPDENSDPNVVPPVVTPGRHVDKRRRTVRSKKTRPHVADPALLADQSGEYLDVGDRTTSCHFCDAPLWELEERDAHDEVWVWSEDDRKFDVQRRKVKCGGKLCCHKGKAVRELAHLFKRPAPDALQKLFDDRESKEGKLFHQNTRGLNIMFQMASSTISTSEHDKRYPHSVMVCEGNIYHPIKAQGLTLLRVGVHVEEDVFSHGQLYVAFSRCGGPDNLCVFRPRPGAVWIKNVVCREVLIDDR